MPKTEEKHSHALSPMASRTSPAAVFSVGGRGPCERQSHLRPTQLEDGMQTLSVYTMFTMSTMSYMRRPRLSRQFPEHAAGQACRAVVSALSIATYCTVSGRPRDFVTAVTVQLLAADNKNRSSSNSCRCR